VLEHEIGPAAGLDIMLRYFLLDYIIQAVTSFIWSWRTISEANKP